MLKIYLLVVFAILPCLIAAQESNIEFRAIELPEDSEYDSINWLGENKVHHEFILKGKHDLKCRLTVARKGNVLLEQSLHNIWSVVDTLSFMVFPFDDEGYLTPQFTITDFNKDGLEDFRFLPMTNMHGTMGYYIYLQDENGILNLLKNKAVDGGDDDSWPAADYDPATEIISCEMPGGVFGSSWEATYKLEGCAAVPLEMHIEVRNSQSWLEQYFKGNVDQWILERQEVDVVLGMGYEDYDKMDVIHYKLEQDGNGVLKMYAVTSDDNENTITAYQESIDITGFVNESGDEDYYNNIPCFLITDFSHDGNHDLVLYTGLDVHGSTTACIFLGNRKTKKLVKLHNTAEDTDVWDTPQYDPKTKIIACRRISGNAGLSFTSIYKLKGFTAEPISKEVQDRTNVNSETGQGYSESSFKGKKGKWILKERVND